MKKKKVQEELDINDISLADEVADTLLEKTGKDKKIYLMLVFVLIFGLLFLVSIITFALLDTYQGKDNIISTGSVLFSFNENGNSISIIKALPTTDDVGKKLSGSKQYFDFTISADFEAKTKDSFLTYEISLIPDANNTLDGSYVRVYLEEDDMPVKILGNEVNSFSSLTNSSIRNGAKVLYKKEINEKTLKKYVFRMWLSKDYKINTEEKVFKCLVAVDTY